MAFEQKLERNNDFRQADILGAKHFRQKNRALALRCEFTWHVQRAAGRPKCLEQVEGKGEGQAKSGWPGHGRPCSIL